MKIPKLIHFVWAGGDKLIPDVCMENAILWARANPSFQIFIWIDELNTTFFKQQLYAYYDEALRRGLMHLSKRQVVGSGETERILPQIQFKDIHTAIAYEDFEPHLDDEMIIYEIRRLRPNYGSLSDLLREIIMYHFGGFYCDLDVYPGTTPLEGHPIFSEESRFHRLLVNPNCQHSGMMGNDVYLSTAKNPLLLQIFDISKRNYFEPSAYLTFSPILERIYNRFCCAALPLLRACSQSSVLAQVIHFLGYYNQSLRLLYTASHSSLTDPIAIRFPELDSPDSRCALWDDDSPQGYQERRAPVRTGNVPLGNVIDPLKDHRYPDGSSPIRYLSDEVTPDFVNHRDWIHIPVKRYSRLEDCIDIIIETIRFEADKMHMFRLDDHIFNLTQSCQVSTEEAISTLSDRLQSLSLDYEAVQYFQLTFFYEYTLNWLLARRVPLEKIALLAVGNETTFRWSAVNALQYAWLEQFPITSQSISLAEKQHLIDVIEMGISYFERICFFIEQARRDRGEFRHLEKHLKIMNEKISVYDRFAPLLSDHPTFCNRIIQLKTRLSDCAKLLDTTQASVVSIVPESHPKSFYPEFYHQNVEFRKPQETVVFLLDGGREIRFNLLEETIDLSNWGLRDQDLKLILREIFSKRGSIERINLYRNNLTDESALLLSQCSIVHVNLKHNNITEIGLDYLLGNSTIQSLNLNRNNLGEHTLQILKGHARLPKCSFKRNPLSPSTQAAISEYIASPVDHSLVDILLRAKRPIT